MTLSPVRDASSSTVLAAVRVPLVQAEEKLRIACRLLRDNGFPESSDELVRDLKHLRVWTQKDGWLDYLDRPEGGG